MIQNLFCLFYMFFYKGLGVGIDAPGSVLFVLAVFYKGLRVGIDAPESVFSVLFIFIRVWELV